MDILIIGVGNCGIAYAADLTLKGHKVTLLKTSNSIHKDTYINITKNNKLYLNENNQKREVTIHKITHDFSDAFKENFDIIIITVQTNYHEKIICKLKEYISKDDIILLEPGYYSTAFFYKHGIENCIIAEAESSPIDCRVDKYGNIDVLFRNVRNPIGIYPQSKLSRAQKILDQLEFKFVYLESIIEAALHNPNLIVHTVGAIMSIPRIEYTQGEYWMYKEVFTDSVWNIVESLDNEKNQILANLGFSKLSYLDASRFRNSVDLTIDSKESFLDYAFNHSPKGPFEPNSRYITEDVSQGLVLMESLGKALNLPTPTCTGLIQIASVALSTDFRLEGRTLEKLGLNKGELFL